jgi:hypothetical protein
MHGQIAAARRRARRRVRMPKNRRLPAPTTSALGRRVVGTSVVQRVVGKPPREMLHKRESTARLTNQQEIPTATKNTAAIQASEPEGLPWMIAIKMIVAAIEHAKAIARLHQ